MNTENGRAKARGVLLAKPELKKVMITFKGQEFEVSEITCGQKMAITKGCTELVTSIEGGEQVQSIEVNPAKRIALFAIEATYVPGTDIKMFSLDDLDALLAGRSGDSFIDSISASAYEFMGFGKAIESMKKSS